MKKEITNFDTDPTQIEYYLVNGQKPTPTETLTLPLCRFEKTS